MATTVVPMQQQLQPLSIDNKTTASQDASALARKRRREILMSQRAMIPDNTYSHQQQQQLQLQQQQQQQQQQPAQLMSQPKTLLTQQQQDGSATKRRRIAGSEITPVLTQSTPAVGSNHTIMTKIPSSTTTTTTTPATTTTANSKANKKKGLKKPQMKYDPDVPMTKEQAAVWRREQRRKRNRESAAASRQRQRDRISELEVELNGWKSKFDAVMKKIDEMEEIARMKVTDELIDSLPTASVLGFNTGTITGGGPTIVPEAQGQTVSVVEQTPAPVVSCTPLASSSVSSPLVSSPPSPYGGAGKVSSDEESDTAEDSSTEDERHCNNKMISRQASSEINHYTQHPPQTLWVSNAPLSVR